MPYSSVLYKCIQVYHRCHHIKTTISSSSSSYSCPWLEWRAPVHSYSKLSVPPPIRSPDMLLSAPSAGTTLRIPVDHRPQLHCNFSLGWRYRGSRTWKSRIRRLHLFIERMHLFGSELSETGALFSCCVTICNGKRGMYMVRSQQEFSTSFTSQSEDACLPIAC